MSNDKKFETSGRALCLCQADCRFQIQCASSRQTRTEVSKCSSEYANNSNISNKPKTSKPKCIEEVVDERERRIQSPGRWGGRGPGSRSE